MGVLLMLWWCAAAALGANSRFGAFNSRLRGDKFPFGLLREFAGKGLIYPTVFVAIPGFGCVNRKNSRYHGNNREFPAGGNGQRSFSASGCLRRKLKSHPLSACRISRRQRAA